MKSLAPGVCQEGISRGKNDGTFASGGEQCPFLCNGRKKKNKNTPKQVGFATQLRAAVWFVRPGLEVCSPLQVQPCSCRAAEAGAGFAPPSQFWGTGLHPPRCVPVCSRPGGGVAMLPFESRSPNGRLASLCKQIWACGGMWGPSFYRFRCDPPAGAGRRVQKASRPRGEFGGAGA